MPRPPVFLKESYDYSQDEFETLTGVIEYYNKMNKNEYYRVALDCIICPQCNNTDLEKLSLKKPVESGENLPLECSDCRTEFLIVCKTTTGGHY